MFAILFRDKNGFQNMKFIAGYLTFLLLVIFPDGAVAYCDVTRLARCARKFQTSLGASPGTSAFDGVSNSSEFRTRLDTVCSAYDDIFQPCYERHFDLCPKDDTTVKTIVYVHEMMNYQCYTGKEGVIQHGMCWMKPVVERKTLACVNRHMGTRALAHIIRSGDLHKLCHHAFKSLTCAGDVVDDHCGKDAAAVYSTLTSYAQLMIAEVASCPKIEKTFGSVGNNPYKTEKRHRTLHSKQGTRRDRHGLLSAPVTPVTVIGRIGGSVKHRTGDWLQRVTANPVNLNWQTSSTARPGISLALTATVALMFCMIM